MRIYKIECHAEEEGYMVYWAATKQEAKRIADEYDDATINILEVRPDKRGFVDFLNTYAPTFDNG